jgi:hypothetical protein
VTTILTQGGTRGRIEIKIPVDVPQGAQVTLLLDHGSTLDGAGVRTETLPESDQYRLKGESGINRCMPRSGRIPFEFGKCWRIGGALAVLDSRTCNDGVALIGMIPLFNYDIGRIKLNAALPVCTTLRTPFLVVCTRTHRVSRPLRG